MDLIRTILKVVRWSVGLSPLDSTSIGAQYLTVNRKVCKEPISSPPVLLTPGIDV
ncbi:hypothetical protein HanXRQr2_Chr01g0002731 [Helianthus annuus]|uniref:Uncharacterized protein n=1 Tax=Helianthus annuus TaxID=4232 RepID=A0A9K3JSM0_HELAN|nr:hypothetical protein HanXRQr2_Chr01g0002731 [Helianthus annuus]